MYEQKSNMIDIGILKIRKSSLISFGLGLAGAMFMVLFQSIHFHPTEIVKPWVERFESRPQVEKASDIVPKLSKFKNTFSLKQNTSLIPKTFAAADYDEAVSYVTIDMDSGEVILQKNLQDHLPIASLTKIMSAVVALDLADSSEEFEVRKDATKIVPTKIGVVEGQRMMLSELLNAALLTSANDAVQVIADGIDAKYGQGTFVDAMNKKAQIIGLSDSHFSNPQGFDSENNYSSAADLAILARYALTNYPLISEIAKKDYEFLPASASHKQFDLYNWNGLLGVYPGVKGLKIGNTDKAGFTTVVIDNRSGKNVAAVLLGAPGVLERDLWTSHLLDDTYDKTEKDSPVKVTREQLLAKYKTWHYWN